MKNNTTSRLMRTLIKVSSYVAREKRLLKDIQKLSNTGGWEYVVATGKEYWTDELYTIYGLKKNEVRHPLQSNLCCFDASSQEALIKATKKLINTGSGFDLILPITVADGNNKWIRTKSWAIFNEDGTVEKCIGSVMDVTKELAVKEALKKSEEKLSRVVNSFDDFISVMDSTGRITDLFGSGIDYKIRNELMGKSSAEIYEPEASKVHIDAFEIALTGEPATYNWSMPNGEETINYQTRLSLLTDKSGILGVSRNVTKETRSRKALEMSENRYKNLFDKSSNSIILIKNHKINECNTATVELLGYKDKEELIGKDIIDISPEEQMDNVLTVDKNFIGLLSLEDRNSRTFEWLHKRKDGMTVPVEVMLTVIQDPKGGELIHAVLRDITDQKKAEQRIQNSLKEKEVLLAEIHHRVKNNLAVISGLMQLQILNSKDIRESEVLEKSINRIKAIALIHEQLYRSTDFSNISLKENIRQQVENISTLFLDKNSPLIKIDLELEEVSIDINQALPIGLLINEIITNSFKHAYKESKKGTISITLREKGDRIFLKISDNGIGLKKGFAESTEGSLGQTLIDTFLKQIGADVIMGTEVGTAYAIEFDKKEMSGSVVNKFIERQR